MAHVECVGAIMKLSDRLNNALATRGLQIQELEIAQPVQEMTPAPVESKSVQFATFDDLKQMIKGANKIQPDEDGVRVVCVKNVGLKEMNLPTVWGQFIIDDIQRNGNGYEVHLVENCTTNIGEL